MNLRNLEEIKDNRMNMWLVYQNYKNVPLFSFGITGQPVAFRKQCKPNHFLNGQLTVQQPSCFAEEVSNGLQYS